MNKPTLRRYLLAGAALVAMACSGLGSGTTPSAGIPAQMIAAAPPAQVSTTTADPDGAGPRPAGPPRLTGELVVDFKDGLTPQQLVDFNHEYQLDLHYNSAHSLAGALTVGQVGEERMSDLLVRLEKDPRVEAVSPNYLYWLDEVEAPVGPMKFPNDPMAHYQWHMDQIHVREAWPYTTGRHVIVSVIDTGVAYLNHGEFSQAEDFDKTRFVPGYDFVNKRDKACDDHCHGTHVAGTVAESTNNGKGVMGVAFGATIMPIKVLSKYGSGSLSNIADGIRFSADHGATVINMSLGGPFGDATMGAAVKYAHAKGVTVVCAAGNSAKNKPGFPAGYPESVSVSATDYEESLTWYTNYGPDIDIAAPGGDTRADKNQDGKPDGVFQNTIAERNPKVNGYYWFQGTSMASPHVAGVAALVNALGVTRPAAVEALLKSTARSKGEEGRKKGYGAGIVDAQRATFRAGFVYGAIRFGLALAVGSLACMALLRRGWLIGLLAAIPGLIVGSSGLFFLPLLGGSPTAYPVFLTSGFPSWDLAVLGAAGHGNPLMFSCLIPMLLAILVVESNLLRALVSGFTAGIAAHLLFAALTGTVAVQFVPLFLSRLWLLANALVCLFLSVVLAEEQP